MKKTYPQLKITASFSSLSDIIRQANFYLKAPTKKHRPVEIKNNFIKIGGVEIY